jgi:protein-S-isoprenylcysteine O-methyltransferase Ste14
VKPLPIAYGLVGCFFVAERLLRRSREAASIEAGRADRGTTRAIGTAFGISLFALALAPFLNRRRIGRIGSPALAWGGTVAMLAGLALRIWAALVLGAFYTRTLQTSVGQRIVMDGPYRIIRHPGYLGDLLLWPGAGMATENWIASVAITIVMGRAFRQRIATEEAMLAEAFPEDYPRYAGCTWRLVPFIY